MESLSRAAFRYACAGLWVYPCEVRGKQPNFDLVPRGFIDASRNPDVVRNWWVAVPESNICVRTQVTPIEPFVLDVDTKHGIDGWATVEDFNLYHQDDPIPLSGPRSTTPSHPPKGFSRGGHIWLRAGDSRPVPSRVLVAPGLDVEGTDGHVMVAPSIVPSGRYRGSPPLENGCVPLAPGWLLDLIRANDRSVAEVMPTRYLVSSEPLSIRKVLARRATIDASEYFDLGRRRLVVLGFSLFCAQFLALPRSVTIDLVHSIQKSANESPDAYVGVVDEAYRMVASGQPIQIRHWFQKASALELADQLFALLDPYVADDAEKAVTRVSE